MAGQQDAGHTWTPRLFYVKTKAKTINPQVGDDALAAGLWNRSAEQAGLVAPLSGTD